MSDADEQFVIVACGIFEKEINELIHRGLLPPKCQFLDSMLHMMPALLESKLQECLAGLPDCQVALVFGDCQPRMYELEKCAHICRTKGMNCCELILGRQRYYKLRSEGAFFLLPEWTERWKEVFQQYLGFNEQTAKLFMAEMHSKLLYLDTGIIPVPTDKLEGASAFCGLPFEIIKVELDELASTINSALHNLGYAGRIRKNAKKD